MARRSTTERSRSGATGPSGDKTITNIAPDHRLPPRRVPAAILAIAAVATPVEPNAVHALDIGAGRLDAEVEGETFDVFTYRPAGCPAPSLLLVFHGNGRTAESYRNAA